jgi:pimeloyl-ACP methyl ester carboxylesterase
MTLVHQDPTAAPSSPTLNTAQPVVLLPGIILPAALRYAPLLTALGDTVRPLVKDLEVYATPRPTREYTIAQEVAGISRAADAAGFERFHLYGHSAGGACALAYLAAHPERVRSLALDEPASDFSPEEQATLRARLRELDGLAPEARMRAFLQWQLAPGVEPPAAPPGPAPDWMHSRPAGIEAFIDAVLRYDLPAERLRSFAGPVYYSYGSLSNPSWLVMHDRLAALFTDFTAEEYVGVHHLTTSHQSDPARVATALRRLWGRAEAAGRRA